MTTCCPDVYYCPASGDNECPRHSAFTICCDQPDKHLQILDRATWHATQDAEERAWLDAWMRGRVCPATLEVCSRTEPAAAVGSLAPAGSC